MFDDDRANHYTAIFAWTVFENSVLWRLSARSLSNRTKTEQKKIWHRVTLWMHEILHIMFSYAVFMSSLTHFRSVNYQSPTGS